LAQLSDVSAGQAEQEAPFLPQAETEAARHWLFWQQPDGQLAASQTHAPPTHDWPLLQPGFVPHRQLPAVQRSEVDVWQLVQTAPLVPQAVSVFDLQTPLKQHPLRQLAELQPLHVPDWHC
jgi:hypothetical protein